MCTLRSSAESWELTPDKSAYIFHLRKGVKFHDGTDFNAAAAKFCWDLNLAPAPPAGGDRRPRPLLPLRPLQPAARPPVARLPVARLAVVLLDLHRTLPS